MAGTGFIASLFIKNETILKAARNAAMQGKGEEEIANDGTVEKDVHSVKKGAEGIASDDTTEKDVHEVNMGGGEIVIEGKK